MISSVNELTFFKRWCRHSKLRTLKTSSKFKRENKIYQKFKPFSTALSEKFIKTLREVAKLFCYRVNVDKRLFQIYKSPFSITVVKYIFTTLKLKKAFVDVVKVTWESRKFLSMPLRYIWDLHPKLVFLTTLLFIRCFFFYSALSVRFGTFWLRVKNILRAI